MEGFWKDISEGFWELERAQRVGRSFLYLYPKVRHLALDFERLFYRKP